MTVTQKTASIKCKSLSGVMLTVAAQSVKTILQLAFVSVMARLLTPEDFGLVGMVVGFTGLLKVFKDGGLSDATVQRRGLTHEQLSNLFWTNCALGGAASLLCVALAPVIAMFYGDWRLCWLTVLTAATFLVSGASVQQRAWLTRELRFRTLATIDVLSQAVGVVVGIQMAIRGFRYWSLGAAPIAIELVSLGLTWLLSDWRPGGVTRRSGTLPLVTFGVHVTIGSALTAASRGIDSILIGRYFGTEAVGIYTRGTALLVRPLEQAMSPLGSVFRPTLSRLQADPNRYKLAFLRIYSVIAVVSCPVSGMIMAMAQPLTIALLGEKWIESSRVFQALALIAMYLPMSSAAFWGLISQGRSRDAMRAQIYSAVISIGSYFVGLPFGPVGVATAYSVSGFVMRLPVFYFIVGRCGSVRSRELWIILLQHLPLWCVVFVTVSWVQWSVQSRSVSIQLMYCTCVGVIVWLIVGSLFTVYRRTLVHLLKDIWESARSR